MSENCNNKQALQRDGTSQPQRILQALLPEYVSVDERSMSDLIAFTQKLNTEIRFYNLADSIDGDWTGFFNKLVSDEQRTEPHYALFIAFLELFAIAQKDLNTITKRHLDYYYREVLNLHERPAVPDQVFTIFELAEQLSSSLVTKGTGLDAKKDNTGVDMVYTTDKDLVVNQAKIDQLKAVFVNKPFDPNASPLAFPAPIPTPDPLVVHTPGTDNDWRIYASPVANSSDGIGGKIEGDEKKWRTFGMPHANDDEMSDRPEGEVGFAFASPLLFMAEGTRTVTITLNFSPPPVAQPIMIQGPHGNMMAMMTEATVARFGGSQSPPPPVTPPEIALNVFFSGEKEWIIPDTYDPPVFDSSDSTLTIKCTLGKGQKAVVAYDEAVLLQPFKTQWPVVKMTLNTGSKQWAEYFNKLSAKTLYTADIKVDVDDVRTLVIQNDDSVLSADKPFVPFTNRPVPGSSFYIGSTEIFQKQLSSLKLNITWDGLPDPAIYTNGFGDYYRNYIPVTEANKRTNTNFKVAASLLYKKAWSPANDSSTYGLFDNYYFDYSTNKQVADDQKSISISSAVLNAVPRDPKMDAVDEFGTTTKRGFIRLSLESPDFGHSLYQNSFGQQAIWNVKGTAQNDINNLPANDIGKGALKGLPPEPYTPTIKELSVDYSSHQQLDLQRGFHLDDEANYSNRIDQFFHVTPFGVAEQHPHIIRQTRDIPLMPQFPDEGSLLIGVSNLVAPEIVSVLFKVAEGSENPDYEKQPVKWSYMSNNEWFEFSKLQLLTDTTNGLVTSGIVTFDVPGEITNTNTALPSGLSWLKASVTKETAAICDLIDVRAQAVTATFVNNGNDPEHLRSPLPAETIKGLVESDAAIDKVIQPYASFGGKVEEQSTDFYVRVSERLRHKHRAVTIWDYEHLVLEKFPNVYKVKCLNHTRYISPSDIHELKPGHVSLVIISNLHNKNAVDPLKPRTSLVTLDAIHDYVVALNPPCAEVHVKNPLFEEIYVDFKVRFLPGYDNGFYGKKLNEEIMQFLAPWAYGGQDIVFGGKIHKSMILNFVEDRPYVDFVTCFNMDQIIPGLPNTAPTVLKNIEEAVTTTSASVLTSAPKHNVVVMENDACNCDDNEVVRPTLSIPEPCPDCGEKEPAVEDGIGADQIGSTFIVGHSRRQGIDFWAIEQDFEIQ